MSKQPPRRLGRGLDPLVTDLRGGSRTAEPLSDARPSTVPAEPPARVQQPSRAIGQMVGIDAIQPNPFQPRTHLSFEELKPLADSIRQNGILPPIVVRPDGVRFQIIAGERRWSAAREVGLKEVPVVVRAATDQQMLELALIENIQREDLNPIDRAMAYRRYCTEFGLNAEEVAARLGEDRTTVVNYIRLLDLPDEIRILVANGTLSMGHGRCLLGLARPERQVALAARAHADQLSVRALEQMVRVEKTGGAAEPMSPEPSVATGRAAHLRDLERRLEEAVKTKVTIHPGRRRGRGKIVIEYYSLDDFDRITERLGVAPEAWDG